MQGAVIVKRGNIKFEMGIPCSVLTDSGKKLKGGSGLTVACFKREKAFCTTVS